MQIDHLVPLAEAWDSGAYRWTHERRVAFANDLDDPRTLVPVSGAINDDKDADDPAWWLPPKNQCRYIEHWIAVKVRWDLSVDLREREAIDEVVAICPNTELSIRRVAQNEHFRGRVA